MKTIAQQLNIKSLPFLIHDANGNIIYHEYCSDGYWEKFEYNANGKKIYWESSTGFWTKYEYDTNGREVYYEDSDGYWWKSEYDDNSNEVYYKDSNGCIRYNRQKAKEYSMVEAKEFSMDEIAKVMGIPVEQLKIRK